MSGSTRKMPRYKAASPISSHLTALLSLVGDPATGAFPDRGRGPAEWSVMARSSTGIAGAPAASCLQEIDDEQDRKREYQHHGGDGRCACIVEFFEPDDDEKGSDFRLVRKISRNEDDRAVFADGAREGERKARAKRRQKRREDHAPDRLEPRCAKRGRRL